MYNDLFTYVDDSIEMLTLHISVNHRGLQLAVDSTTSRIVGAKQLCQQPLSVPTVS